MNLTKQALFAAVVAGSAMMTGCGDSGSSSSSANDNNNAVTDAACIDFDGTMNAAGTECTLSKVLTKSTTLSKNITYILDGLVKVGNGDSQLVTQTQVDAAVENGVTLTIPAGTKIKGLEASALIITRGSKIMAEGTAAEPIVFSSVDEGENGSGEWGGLVLQGFGVTNQCPDTGLCNILGEGGVGFYGGTDNTDSSGTLKYVVVTEGGYAVSLDNELNGVSFMGVGSGTTVDFLQVNENADDGVEFWGGAVMVKHLVITQAEDDSIDWDQGFVGGVQYGIVVQKQALGIVGKTTDKGIESDNDGAAMDNDPRSMPTIANVTFKLNPETIAVHHREGTGVKAYNNILIGALDCFRVQHDATLAEVANGELSWENSIAKCTNAAHDTASEALLNSQTSSINTTATGSLNANYAWSVAGEATNKTFTADNSAVESNSYVGAVDPAASSFWYAGWTVSGSL